MKYFFFIFCCCFSFGSMAQNMYQERALKNISYLIRDSILLEQIKIDDQGISIYASSENKKKDIAELLITWDDVPIFLTHVVKENKKNITTEKIIRERQNVHQNFSLVEKEKPTSLKGVRIVLDPGHFAHNFKTAILERKFIKIHKKETGTKKDIEFFESDLAWKTAIILAKRLENKGAEVLITRKKGKSALGYSFLKWKNKLFKKELQKDLENKSINQEQYNWYLQKATDKDIYRYMNKKDLIERAQKINSFRPQLTINIHYNASGSSLNSEGYFSPTASNYCMAFVGGGFMKGELNSKEARLHFLRLLLSNDLEQSIHFSDEIIKAHTEIIKVPHIPNKNNLFYLNKNSVYTNIEGVYCRNLALTRMVQGVICFGESLLQDNINEAVLLSQKNYKESKIKTSNRVKLVVDAYEQGILNYIEN